MCHSYARTRNVFRRAVLVHAPSDLMGALPEQPGDNIRVGGAECGQMAA